MTTPVFSHELAYRDQAQYQHRQGPCLQAIAEHETVIIGDLESERIVAASEVSAGPDRTKRARDLDPSALPSARWG